MNNIDPDTDHGHQAKKRFNECISTPKDPLFSLTASLINDRSRSKNFLQLNPVNRGEVLDVFLDTLLIQKLVSHSHADSLFTLNYKKFSLPPARIQRYLKTRCSHIKKFNIINDSNLLSLLHSSPGSLKSMTKLKLRLFSSPSLTDIKICKKLLNGCDCRALKEIVVEFRKYPSASNEWQMFFKILRNIQWRVKISFSLSITITNSQFDPNSFESFPSFTKIHSLNISLSKISQTSVVFCFEKFLSKLKALKTFEVSILSKNLDIDFINNIGSILQNATGLESLSMRFSNANIDDKRLFSLARSLRKLESLRAVQISILFCHFVTSDTFLQFPASLSFLKHLKTCKINIQSCAFIENSRVGCFIRNLVNGGTTRGLEALDLDVRSFSQLTSTIDFLGLQAFSSSLKTLKLCIERAKWTTETMKSLEDAIQSLNSLESLKLDITQNLSEEGAPYFFDVLKKTVMKSTLTSISIVLELNRSILSPQRICDCILKLGAATRLKKLHLSIKKGTGIDNYASTDEQNSILMSLSQAVSNLPELEELIIDIKHLSNYIAVSMVNLFRTLSILRRLSLFELDISGVKFSSSECIVDWINGLLLKNEFQSIASPLEEKTNNCMDSFCRLSEAVKHYRRRPNLSLILRVIICNVDYELVSKIINVVKDARSSLELSIVYK